MTIINQDLTQVGFHEATLAGISQSGDTVTLALDDVCTADTQRAVKVDIINVRAILRENVAVEHFLMEKKYGEVLTLREENGQVFLVVDWDDFTAKVQNTVVYVFTGENVILRLRSLV